MKNVRCAIILVRVSTAIQNFEPQVADLIKYAEKLGYKRLHKIETKESGLADIKDKQGLEALKLFIKDNPDYKTIFATELSRIGRRQSVLHEIKEWLISNKIQLHLKDTGYSLFDIEGNVSAAGEIMFTLYGYFAESELKTKKDRFQRAKKHLMSLGLSISGKTLFGYKKQISENQKNTLIVDEKNGDVVKQIFDWYLNGLENNENPSIREISVKCLKENYPPYTYSKRNVNKLLKEEGYTGYKVTNNKRKNPNYSELKNEPKYIITQNEIKYPQIISKEIFDAVQNKLKINNTTADKSNKHTTLLSRMIVCPTCGNFFTGDYRIQNNTIKNSLRCGGRSKTTPCANKLVLSMGMMDSTVWSLIKTDLKLLSETINKINPDENLNSHKINELSIKKRLDSISSEILDLEKGIIKSSGHRNVNLSKLISAFDSRINKLSKEKEQLHKELVKIKNQIKLVSKKSQNVEEVIIKNLKEIENSRELLKKYIMYFVKRIEILSHNKQFTILKIHFKQYNVVEKRIIHPDGKVEIPDNEFGVFTFIFLDKRTTRNIKAIKATRNLTILTGDKIKLNRIISLQELFDTNNIDFETRHELRDLKRFQLTKLKLSQ